MRFFFYVSHQFLQIGPITALNGFFETVIRLRLDVHACLTALSSGPVGLIQRTCAELIAEHSNPLATCKIYLSGLFILRVLRKNMSPARGMHLTFIKCVVWIGLCPELIFGYKPVRVRTTRPFLRVGNVLWPARGWPRKRCHDTDVGQVSAAVMC